MQIQKNNYKFDNTESEEVQFELISNLMDDIEESTFGELVFKIDINYNKKWMLEIFEHAEEDDHDSFDSLEMVDWYTGNTLEDVFNFLMERYV
ncbi:hypothetical protein DQT32_04660 [Salmonella enterica subsp. enterica serovar Braenderup]|nr:hypothetical protein [Salmonella enterica subsp. enterica serovar Braenderup]